MKKWLVCFMVFFVITGCLKHKQTPDNGGGGTTTKIPGKATLLTPAQNSICISGTGTSTTESMVTFTWTATANTDAYDIVYKNLLLGTSITQTVTAATATVSLLRNTPYSWYISSKTYDSSTTTQSDTWKFYNSGAGIVSYAPFPAEIIDPAYGQLINASVVNLHWKGTSVDNNIVGYNVYLGTTTTPPVFKPLLTDDFINAVPVNRNTTYYWHVVTVDANGNYSDSGLYQFTVQ